MKAKLFSTLIIISLLFSVVSCAGTPEEPTISAPTATIIDEDPRSGGMVKADAERVMMPDVLESEMRDQVAGNNAFSFDLYHAVREEAGNLFYSPYSISLALAMTYAGARGETEDQMAQVLHVRLSQERLHPVFNAIDLELERRGEEKEGEIQGKKFQLNIANAVWGQAGYNFLSEYLDVLAKNYGAGLQTLVFINAPEESRQTINEWVSEQTQGKIKDLLSQGAVDTLTRLILTNAVYFNASWLHPFEVDDTQDGTFHTLDGEDVITSMMEQTERFGYVSGEDYQAVELPYVGGEMSMVILLPSTENFKAFERSLDTEQVNAIIQKLELKNITLTMPKFEFESKLGLSETLASMGMVNAFSPEEANFSGIKSSKDLYITDVLHKAFVSVDESGTEAAAATAVVVGITSAPAEPLEVKVDHPFLFLIRDTETGTILFIGRVLNPSTQG